QRATEVNGSLCWADNTMRTWCPSCEPGSANQVLHTRCQNCGPSAGYPVLRTQYCVLSTACLILPEPLNTPCAAESSPIKRKQRNPPCGSMIMRVTFRIQIVALAIIVGTSASSPAADSWVGKKVMPRKADIQIGYTDDNDKVVNICRITD